uniref:SET domain-containing protein n=1 Tax=Romanomermis culicivorax TaxID=13658 RepID=A0A915J4E4_ROMCU
SRVLTTPAGSVTSVNLLTPDRDHTTHGHQNQYNALTGQSDVMLSSSSILNNSPPLNYHMDQHIHHQPQHHSSYADPNSYSQPAPVDYNNNAGGQNYAMRHIAPMQQQQQPPPPGQMATDVKRAGRPRGGRPTFYAPPNQQAGGAPIPNNGQATPQRRLAPIVVGPAQAAQSRRQNSGSYNYAVQPGVGPTFYNSFSSFTPNKLEKGFKDGSTAQMQTIASGRIVQQGANQYMDDGLPVVPIDLPEDPSCSDNFDFSSHRGGPSNMQHEAAMNANGLMTNLSSGHPLQQQQSSFQQQTTTVNNNDIFGDQCRSMFDRLFKELGVENDAEAASRAAAAVAELNELAKANKIDQAAEERFIKKYRRQLQDMARKRRLAAEGVTPAKKPPKPKKPKKEPSSTTTKPKKSSTTANQRGRPPKTSKKVEDAAVVPVVKKEESRQDDSDQDSQESDGEIAADDDTGGEKQERLMKAMNEQQSSSQQKIKATVDQLQATILAKDRLRKKSEKVWQHCDCMGLKKRSIPEKYLCHVCKPRLLPLTKEKARKLQTKKLNEMKAKKRAQKKKNSHKRKTADGKKSSSSSSRAKVAASKKILRKRQNLNTKLEHRKLLLQRLLTRNAAAASSAKTKTMKKEDSSTIATDASKILTDQTPMSKAKRREMLRNQKETFDEFYAAFTAVDVNEYSEDVLDALREESDTVGASLLDQLPMGAPCLAMYVTKERRGLVANLTIPPDQPIFEYRGKFCSISEFSGRDVDGYILPYVLFYRGLQKGDGSLSPKLDLCVDARFKGTDARFIRRSCQPNTQVKHVIKDGELHLLIISTELIESATEVTIPFDYDFRSW